ncbi:MAG: cupin domain-containing protein [Chloroflexi bacterium]|nr:cupin domain-containing protein [Chloroflexota bacterium]MBV9547622.1 cupin domain-containing protein [Chloroflexota bacterium]
MSTQTDGVVALAPGTGLPITGAGTGPGSELIVKALEADTHGAYSLLEWRSERGGAWVPPHIHQAEEEAWYVLEGELTFRIGDRTIPAPAGSFILVPRGTLHSFANTGAGPARYLQLFSPGGMERYFAERAALLRDAAPGPPDRAVLTDLNRRYGMEFVESRRTS